MSAFDPGATGLENGSSKVHNCDMFDWNDLKYFLAVARRGSTLGAARALGTSQSTVHRRLKELETRLDRALITPHPTGYRLTELGKRMLAHAERVEESVTSFERHLAASDQELTGVIRVTCPEAVGYRLMRSRLLEKFNARFPALHVELVMSDKFLDLAKGEADIAIRAVAPSKGTLVGRRIADLPWAVYANRTYIKRRGRIERFENIDDHRIIRFDGLLSDHHAARWLRSVAPNAMVAARADSLPTLLLAVKSGAGIAPLPLIIGEGERNLERMLGPIPNLVTHFYLLMHEDMKRTPRVRAFFDFFIAELKTIRPILGCNPRLRSHRATLN